MRALEPLLRSRRAWRTTLPLGDSMYFFRAALLLDWPLADCWYLFIAALRGPAPGTEGTKKELLEAQRLRKETLKRQIHRAQFRITATERKRRTRRLVLLGSYLEHVTGDDPGQRDRLIKGLDVFLERGLDRELFDLPNKEHKNGNPD